jgi:integrase/recombinase XerD
MTPLRRRMIEDMRLHDLAPKTERAYVDAVAALARHYGRSPELLGEEDLRQYFLYLVEERQLAKATVRQHLCGVKFFFETTLSRRWPVFDRIKVKRGRRLPLVMSREEVQRLLAAVHMPRHRIAMLLGYACGLRISEVLGLRVAHIDGERKQLRIEQGKGRKDRYVPISDRVLARLREYWVISRPADLLFASRYVAEKPASAKSLQRAVRLAADEAGIAKHVTFHTLRHCYGTHLLECGVDLRTIQTLMGHKSCETTAIYTHLTDKTLERLGRALDELSENL